MPGVILAVMAMAWPSRKLRHLVLELFVIEFIDTPDLAVNLVNGVFGGIGNGVDDALEAVAVCDVFPVVSVGVFAERTLALLD